MRRNFRNVYKCSFSLRFKRTPSGAVPINADPKDRKHYYYPVIFTWISDLGWESAEVTALGHSWLNLVEESPYSWMEGGGEDFFWLSNVRMNSTNFSSTGC